MSPIPFQIIDWSTIDKVIYPGKSGMAQSQTIQFPGLRIRIVEYQPGYIADHWCTKGHVVYCLEVEFISEMENGDQFTLNKGMSYIVSDERSVHRSKTYNGVRLLIIDGDFLK